MLLQQPLNWDRELPQEALDDWPTLGELILDLNLQDVGGERHETEALVNRAKEKHFYNVEGAMLHKSPN